MPARGSVVLAVVAAVALTALRRLLEARAARPLLPAADRPPSGLGRLIPVGAQVEDECRRGLAGAGWGLVVWVFGE